MIFTLEMLIMLVQVLIAYTISTIISQSFQSKTANQLCFSFSV